MRSYGQYCPIARTSEFFAERWTPIIVRNLASGCRTFTELRDGAPGIPRALLAERLELLERYGVITRTPKDRGHGSTYALTESGRELTRVCDAMGAWGARWLELEPDELDPAYTLWATARLADLTRVPAGGVIVRFDVTVQPLRRFWMLLREPEAELCTAYPGRPEDLIVTADAGAIAVWNLRRASFEELLSSGRLRVEGPPHLARALPTWIRPSPFASVEPAR